MEVCASIWIYGKDKLELIRYDLLGNTIIFYRVFRAKPINGQ